MNPAKFGVIRTATAQRAATGVHRSYHRSAIRQAGKESALHEENRAEKLEAVQEDQLEKVKEGKSVWRHELASDSEGNIKADRNEILYASSNIKELQQATAQLAQAEERNVEKVHKKDQHGYMEIEEEKEIKRESHDL